MDSVSITGTMDGTWNSGADDSDAALAQRATAGDRAAADVLVMRHQALVRGYLRRLTGGQDQADDLAQETFLRMFRHLARYDSRYSMRTWLLTIAYRLWINDRQRPGRHQAIVDERFIPQPMVPPALDEQDEQAHLRCRLDGALGQLTDAQRSAVTLVHQQGLSVQEAARVMRMPAGTIKSHLHRGRARLRELLGSAAQSGDQP